MSLPLFRTSLARSTQFFNVSPGIVSRTVNVNLAARAPSVILLSHSVLARRNFTTNFVVNAVTDKSASAKKTTKLTGTVAKKEGVANEKPKVKKKEKVVKESVKAKKKVTVKAPRIFKKDWKPPFKKPLTSWAKFVFEFWKSKAADKPTHLKDLLPAASVEWKSMSDEQKADYAPSASEVEEYRHRLAEWNAGLSRPLKQAKRKWGRSHRRASSPRSPLTQFVKEQFHQIEYASGVTTPVQKMQHLARLYTELSEEDKAALKERAKEEYSRKQEAST